MSKKSQTAESVADESDTKPQTAIAAIGVIGTDLYEENRPDVSEHAIAAEQAEEQAAVVKDKGGDTFNPEEHAVNTDGSPKFTVGGTFAKKRGRKAGKAQNSTVAKPTQAMQNPNQKYQMTGAAIAESIFMVGRVIGGDEWQPIVDEKTGVDERKNMTDAWSQYAQAKDIGDVPPGVLVAIVMVGYIGPRLAGPKTKTRLQLAWTWLKAKMRNRSNGTRANSGNDGKRENDASKATGSGSQ